MLCLTAGAETRPGAHRETGSRALISACDDLSSKLMPYLEGCYSAARKCEKEFPGTNTSDVLKHCEKLWCYKIKQLRTATNCSEPLGIYRNDVEGENPSFFAIHKASTARPKGPAAYVTSDETCS